MHTIEQIRARLAAAVGGEKTLASWYSARTMRDLNARAARELDSAAANCLEMLEQIALQLGKSDYGAFRQCTDEEHVARYVRLWAAWQSAGSRVANWMVTGPAAFPVERNNKRIASEDRRYLELKTFRDGAPAAAVKRARLARARAIGAGGLAAVDLAEAEARLATRERRQQMMKEANAIIRRLKLTEPAQGEQLHQALRALRLSPGASVCAQLLVPNYMGKRGFEAFQLSNNSAEIRRLQIRVAELKAKVESIAAAEQAAAPAPTVIAGVELIEDAADDRLRLIFPGKPDDRTRALLKGRGFRWSPTAGAWQRQLTDNARQAAQGILAQLAA